jgi:DNA-binding transcriptional LysR family regulator
MNIHSVDLNLFLVFHAIYLTRSVTLAGDRLNMTQSATSNALKRLRERLNDPLFVKTPDGMMPTPLADRLFDPIEAGITQLTGAIDQGRQFDPINSNRVFRVAINDIGQLVVIPQLLELMRQEAPNVYLETVDASSAEAKQKMLNGKIDLAVGSWEAMGPSFYQQRLFDETFVVLMSATNPLCKKNLNIEEYMAADHIAYSPSGTTNFELEQLLDKTGIIRQRKVVLTAAHSLGLSTIVASSNLLLTAPNRLAKAMLSTRKDLFIAPAPFDVSPFQIKQQWHERFHLDSGNRWLRNLLFRICSQPV